MPVFVPTNEQGIDVIKKSAGRQCQEQREGLNYRKFGLKPRPFRTALSYNGKSDNQAKN
jgi:hypothetical protein